MYIKRVCCYCQKYLGCKKVADTHNPKFNITHGICSDCKDKVMMELEEMPLAINLSTTLMKDKP